MWGRGTHKYFCVGIIDIIDSTKTVAKLSQNKASRYYELFLNTMAKTVAKLSQNKASRYYELFLNTMAKTVAQSSAHILKTMGVSLLFYFPDTCYCDRKFSF